MISLLAGQWVFWKHHVSLNERHLAFFVGSLLQTEVTLFWLHRVHAVARHFLR